MEEDQPSYRMPVRPTVVSAGKRRHDTTQLPIHHHVLLARALPPSFAADALLVIESYWTDWYLLWSYGLTETGRIAQQNTRNMVRDDPMCLDGAPASAIAEHCADRLLTFLAASHPTLLTGEQLQDACWMAEHALVSDGGSFLQQFGGRVRYGAAPRAAVDYTRAEDWIALIMTFRTARQFLEPLLSEMIDSSVVAVCKTETETVMFRASADREYFPEPTPKRAKRV